MFVARPTAPPAVSEVVPPHAWFGVSALFHYLGPAFAVLLFARIEPAGVGLLRIAGAAIVFAAWRRPWRSAAGLNRSDRRLVVAMGVTLAAMNLCFYEAIARVPLGTVGAIEFLGPVALAASGLRTRRNGAALLLACLGALVLADIQLAGTPAGVAFAALNCLLFMLYVVVGHRFATAGGLGGIDRLALAMLVAAIAALPFGGPAAAPALADPVLLASGFGVAVCSSVIPYVADQMAMARLPRATFALLLSLLPAVATLIGAIVLAQWPGWRELLGIGLVMAGVVLHRPAPEAHDAAAP